MFSIRTRLFLNTLPFTYTVPGASDRCRLQGGAHGARAFRYISWYMCLSIFLESRYLRARG